MNTSSAPRPTARRPRLRRTVTTGVVTSAALALAACGGVSVEGASGGSGDSITLTFASAAPKDQATVANADWFMDEVEKRTDGRVKWEKHYSGALLGSSDTSEGIKEGRADAAYFVSSYDPATFPLYDIGYVPLPESNAVGAAQALREMYKENEALQAEADRAGVKMMIHLGVANPDTIAMPERMDGMDDLQGQKIRFIGPITDAIKQGGANPVPLAAEEIYESLERGVIDGMGGAAIDSITGYGFEEVAPWVHYLPLGYYGSSISMIFNQEAWDELPEDVRTTMEEVVDDYYEQLPTLIADSEAAACDQVIDAGGGALRFPADEQESEQWVDEVGDSLFDGWRETAVRAGVEKETARAFAEEWRTTAIEKSKESDYVPGAVECIEKTADQS